MESNKIRTVVNDLVRINNDRIDGYRKAIEELTAKNGDNDLITLFNDYMSDSEQNKAELISVGSPYNTESADETTVPGEIYRVWMDLKAAFSGNTRKAVLESCEYGEDAAQKAYAKAIENNPQLPDDIMQLIMVQKGNLRDSHDKIKRLRNQEKAKA